VKEKVSVEKQKKKQHRGSAIPLRMIGYPLGPDIVLIEGPTL
jgi:hypothetical protein